LFGIGAIFAAAFSQRDRLACEMPVSALSCVADTPLGGSIRATIRAFVVSEYSFISLVHFSPQPQDRGSYAAARSLQLP
jgi:hypothetical protein